MFCFQCQETAKGTACTIKGVCGKTEPVANLQDLLIYNLKGISQIALLAKTKEIDLKDTYTFIVDSLFATITNANFSAPYFIHRIEESIVQRENLKKQIQSLDTPLHDAALWQPNAELSFEEKAKEVSILHTTEEDVRSLRELVIYGLKGMAAYVHHARVLNHKNNEIEAFFYKGLASTLDDSLPLDKLIALVLECGKFGVEAMSLLDQANTESYGHPEITEVSIGVRNNPAILISGHDLKDISELLEQTKGTGVDVYTHSEMLSAHYYPAFKKYDHFAGNYGNAWWQQKDEFEKFNGPILMTTNCLVEPRESYKHRIFTTGVVGFAGLPHIDSPKNGKQKDFSAIIAMAKKCPSPTEIETGTITGGFAHDTVEKNLPTLVEAIKNGDIKKFIVMGGCDGRMKNRTYYTEFAKALPKDMVILTAGCAKYRYNKLNLGTIGNLPRVLDAGQCNDSYSLVLTALKLKEAFGLESLNDLPLEYNIAWYEQKAVIVLLALLYLDVKNIRLGPSLPAFLSPNVVNILVDNFGIRPINSVQDDIQATCA